MRSIAIFGSTGSIGTQALEVIKLHPTEFKVVALSAHKNARLLFEQVRAFRVPQAVLTGADLPKIPADLSFCKFYQRHELDLLAQECPADDALISVVGVAGLSVTLAARSSGKRILLANKETLVAGGALVTAACPVENGQPTLLPVDSEHSAIFQCIQGSKQNTVEKIYLTASGGPFRTWNKESIASATLKQALNHPTWHMGSKITIDSASMFNKALEIIEAKWLFHVPPQKIEVVVHPQSIVHSMVGFSDGAVIAQMGLPDMRVPILYAMSYPKRMETGVALPDFSDIAQMTFEKGDAERFPALRLAYEALGAGGAACCVLNAANEVAVDAFLNRRITFGAISTVVEETLKAQGSLPLSTIRDVYAADEKARDTARLMLKDLEC